MIGLLALAQLAIVAQGPDTATTCAPMEISIAARAPGTIAPRIAPLAMNPPIQLLKSSVVTRVERDALGHPSSLAEATFIVATNAIGRLTLPRFMASVGAERAVAVPLPVNVHSSGVLPPTVLVRAWLDRSGEGGRAGRDGSSDTLYVGQQVDYVVDVQVNESARQRLRRNPTFFPPEMPGVLAYDLAPPAALARVGRRCFETLSYRRALFPLFAGRTTIAPAALTYSLPLSTSFFSREESFELRTDSVRFVAVDVPVEGRPTEFAGAVGSLGAAARLSTVRARMGDPVVLTLRLEGSGNVKLWPRPAVAMNWGSVAEGGERVQVDTSQPRVRGYKEFDWLLTPRQPGHQAVPRIAYSYFDADRGAYATVTTPALTLDVAAAALAAVDTTTVTRLGIRRSLRDELPEPAPSRPWYWLLLMMAPVPAAVRRALDNARTRTERRSAMRRLLSSASRGEGQRMTVREVRRLYRDAIGERVPATIGTTNRDVFARALRRAGVMEDTSAAASALFERLDAAAFSPFGATGGNVIAEASAVAKAIDAQAVWPHRRARSTPVVIALLCASAAGTVPALPDGVTQTFRQGVDAYDQSAFITSQRLFARVAARAPRAVDAWANLGTAAWSRGDSAAAVRGWQRALRLDPFDVEARERLDAVQAPRVRARGYVPPLAVDLLAFTALACWLVAWMLLAIPPARRPRNARALAGGGLIVAVASLVSALAVRERLDPRGMAVLRTSRMLLEAPASRTALASGAIGETGVLGAREGGWVRISLDDGRAGWVPVTSVLSLDTSPIDD